MDPEMGLTRRQQIWLLDRQVEAVDRAVSDIVSRHPDLSASAARRRLEQASGIPANALSANRVATRILDHPAVHGIELAMGFAPGSIHPLDALPPHDSLGHPDLEGLRLWEGARPSDEGSIPLADVEGVFDRVMSLPGRNLALVSRATGLDPTFISRMVAGSCRSVRKSSLRILAHSLGLAPKVFGLEGPANVDPPTLRPDLRYLPGSQTPAGGVTSSVKGGFDLPRFLSRSTATASPEDVLDLTDPIADEPVPESGRDADAAPSRSQSNHVRRISRDEVDGRAAGIAYVVHPNGKSSLEIIGRMTDRRIVEIAAALGIEVEGERAGETALVDLAYHGDDATVARGYAAAIAPPPAKGRRRTLAS